MLAKEWKDVPAAAMFLADQVLPAAREIYPQLPRGDWIVLDPMLKLAAGGKKGIPAPSGYNVGPDSGQLTSPVVINGPPERPLAGLLEPVTRATGITDSWLARRMDGPNPMSAALAGGLVSGGLGYLGGRVVENVMPGVFERGKLRRNLAMLGAGLGVLPAAYFANYNYRDNPDAGFWDAWRRPNPLFGGKSAIHRAFQKSADAGAFMPNQQIPVDSFNRVVLADPFTPMILRQATSALLNTADSAGGGTGLISPYDLARIGIGMGAGFAQAYVGGRVLGALAGLSPEAQINLQRTGAFAGALKAAVPGIFGMR